MIILIDIQCSQIPKKIWTYWGGSDVPKTVIKCIDSWKKHNPGYEITLLNDKLLKKLLSPDDYKLIDSNNNFLERKSDYIRIMIIYKYGGIWMDSSIFCNEPMTWIPMKNYDFVGFISPQTTNFDTPIIENWFFAAPPKSILIKEWLKECIGIKKFNSEKEYANYVINKGIDIQGLSLPYLIMHLALLRVTTEKKHDYKVKLFNSIGEDGPFKYLHDVNWNSEEAVDLFLNGDASKQKLVKLRGVERKILEKKCYIN